MIDKSHSINIPVLFEDIVAKFPDKVAIIYKNKKITYKELNIKANELAHKISSTIKVRPDLLIALYLNRDEHMIISILAVLKAGCAYVPIDPKYPYERVNYILSDTAAKLIITNEEHQRKLNSLNIENKILCTDDKSPESYSGNNLETTACSNSLAYVIYTSGTTGKPKGVMIEHGGVCNLARLKIATLDLTDQLKTFNCLFYANYVFDAHVWEIYSCLLNGHTLHIIDDATRHDIELLQAYIKKNNVQIGLLTPAVLDTDHVLPLDVLLVGGERISQAVLQKYIDAKITAINAYGPTEITVMSSCHLFESVGDLCNIGGPLNHYQYYIIRDDFSLIDDNEIGELCIASQGIARGYLNNADLTHEKFISHPTLGIRMYRTGDLVQRNKDNTYQHIGRNDSQVKIRGHRIELGEIEAAINQFSGVTTSVVITSLVYDPNTINQSIIAYFTADILIDTLEISNYLSQRLPAYMVPAILVQIEKLPLTYNGKIDKIALPNPYINLKNHKSLSRNSIDSKIIKIWSAVLNIDQNVIGIDDNFFYLGGNSILAIKLIKELNFQLNVNLSAVDLFELRTIRKLSDNLDLKKEFKLETICQKNEVNLSEKLILRDYYSSDYKNIYNENFVVELYETLKEEDFRTCIKYLLEQYEILNSNYQNHDSSFHRVMNKNSEPEINYIDLSNDKASKQTFIQQINQIVRIPFDIANDKLIRFALFKFDDNHFKLLVVFFHAILDGTSVINLLLPNLYQALIKKTPINKVGLDSYHLFSNKIARIYNENIGNKIKYWSKFFSHAEPCVLSQTVLSDSASIVIGQQQTFTIGPDCKSSLIDLSKALSLSLFDILAGCFILVLNKFSQKNCITIRTNVDERIFDVNSSDILGCFINNLFLTADINLKASLADLFRSVSQSKNQSIVNLVSYDVFLSNFRDKVKDLSTIHFNIEPESYKDYGYAQSQIETHSGEVKNDLYFELDMKKDCILGRVEYKTAIFNQDLINSLIQAYQVILQQAHIYSSEKIGKINLLSNAESQKIIHDFNSSHKTFPNCKTLTKLFEEQALYHPEHTALVYNGTNMSYGELNRKANRFAWYLKKYHGVKSNDLVCLCLDKNILMIEVILGVLKAGGAYVPIEPSYPEQRIHHIVTDTASKLFITNETHEQTLNGYLEPLGLKTLAYDNRDLQALLSEQLDADPIATITPNNLAYVIYTSGTTGKPKGVLQTHGNVARLLLATEPLYHFNEHDIWTLFHAYVFDFSVWELWGALVYGGKLVVPSYEQTRDFAEFHTLCQKEQVTVLNQTPSAFYQFMEFAQEKKLPALRYIIFGGEALHLPKLKSWFAHYGDKTPELINMYGITETTVHVTYHKLTKEHLAEKSQIGKVLSNLTAYVLDDHLNPVPIGALGELYVGGSSLALGYLNRPELTKERFIDNPFATGKLYKTGDLVRWLANGGLEYIGRNDFQVKIRGYRIELGEIESALLNYPGIKQAVVLAKKNQTTDSYYLISYYVAEEQISDLNLMTYLHKKLPEHMIPQSLTHLTELPLTINGKLDREKLPEPNSQMIAGYAAARTELEHEVVKIWSEVLGVDVELLSIRDDFFRLGGDSIISIQVVSRMRQRLGLIISVRAIFTCRTIERLFDEVILQQELTDKVVIKAEQGLLAGKVPLLPIGHWFFAQKLINHGYYNQAFLIAVPKLDVTRLNDALIKLIAYHDCLRLRYGLDKQGFYSTTIDYSLQQLDVSTLSSTAIEDTLSKWQSQFVLDGSSSLFTVGYLHGYADGSARIYFALHHLLVDVVSWRIITDDLKRLYYGESLGDKSSSYRQWVDTVNAYADTHQAEQHYWAQVIGDYEPTALTATSNRFCSMDFNLSTEETSYLLQESGKVYNTQINDILLTALGLSLVGLTGKTVNHIVLEGHGRQDLDAQIDVSRTIGWFTTLYPVRLVVCHDLGLSLKGVKDSLRKIPNRGIGYGALFGYEQQALPAISFNYLGQLDNGTAASWNICADKAGEVSDSSNIDPYVININGSVVDGHLQFNIQSKLSPVKTIELAEGFKQNLQALITHTKEQGREYLTCSDIGYIINQHYLDELQQERQIDGVYHANSLQQGFIYHALSKQYETDETYRVQIIWQYNNVLAVEQLKQAWNCALIKYPALRLRFAWDNAMVQVIDHKLTLNWQYVESCDAQLLAQIKAQDQIMPYDLTSGPLFRIWLIKESDNKYTCIFNNHHAILDGWGVSVLLDYIHATYSKLCNNEQPDLTVDLSYQQAQEYLQNNDSDKAYWDKYLAQVQERINLEGLLKLNKRDVIISEYKHIEQTKEETLILDSHLQQKLSVVSQQYGVTLNAILQYAWHKVLSVYSNSKQTVVGTVVSGRNLPIDNLERSVGLYINTLPLIVNHQDKTVIEIIQAIQHDINEANSRNKVSLADLQSGGQRLFDSLFIYENYPVSKDKNPLINVEFALTTTKLDYPLALICETDIRLRYAAELFSQDTAIQLLARMVTILEQVTSVPKILANNLKTLSQQEYNDIIYKKNETTISYPVTTLHELFKQQAIKTPANIAVEFNNASYTYAQVDSISDQFAYNLQTEYKVKNGDIIAVYIDRSEFTLITILSILKASAAYLPIDVNYPDERIAYILNNANTKLIVSRKNYHSKFDIIQSLLISPLLIYYIDDAQPQDDNINQINFVDDAKNSNLAYVIYTSGTTGRPKGVMIEHGSIVSRLLYLKEKHCLNENYIFGAKTAYVFDPSIREMFLPLISGGRIIIFSDDDSKDVDRILQLCLIKKINGLLFVPSQLSIFVEALKTLSTEQISQLQLRLIYSCGEILSIKLVQEIFKYLPNINLKNQYGPTEGCQFSFEHDINIHSLPIQNRVPVGKLVANMQAYILDKDMNPVPELAAGELYITGDGLARGYISNTELTNASFIVNKFQSYADKLAHKNQKLYKTGDLARWQSDGNLEYIGRNDFQVKIRGHRIDLGEIENVLLDYTEVKQAVLIAHKDYEGMVDYLVAYYVANEAIEDDLILQHLKRKLPDYMIPRGLMHLTSLPLTINGKLDRSSLPKYGINSVILGDDDLLSDHEQKTCLIYAEVLGIQKFRLDNNFFDLGGNSISSFKLVNRLRSSLMQNITIKHIYEYPTARKLLEYYKEINLRSEEGVEIEF